MEVYISILNCGSLDFPDNPDLRVIRVIRWNNDKNI